MTKAPATPLLLMPSTAHDVKPSPPSGSKSISLSSKNAMPLPMADLMKNDAGMSHRAPSDDLFSFAASATIASTTNA